MLRNAVKAPKRILFFGSSEIAVPTLESLHAARSSSTGNPLVSNLEAVVPPLRPKGRNARLTESSVEVCAKRLGLRVHAIDPDVDFRMNGYKLPDGEFDLGVVISFGYFIRPDIINSFRTGMINAHASLLPRLRGAAPIQHALFHGESTTGISIITLHPTRIDEGRVLMQKEVAIKEGDTFESLSRALAPVAASSVLETISEWDSFLQNSQDQARLIARLGPPPPHLATAPKLSKSIGNVDWSRLSALEVYRLWQGICGFVPMFTFWNTRRVILRSLRGFKHHHETIYHRSPTSAGASESPSPSDNSVLPGTVRFDDKIGLTVVCANGDEVVVDTLQLEYAKSISGEEFRDRFMHGANVRFMKTMTR